MFSLWGIRTLASDCIKYNPMSYHNGSIWPHDNAIIAMGLARYGFKESVKQVFEGLFEATTFIELHRLPELFCGLKKRNAEGPTAYPVACSPQAWAVGSVFLLLEALLGLEIDAIKKQIIFHEPVLPDKIEELHIRQLPLLGDNCNFKIIATAAGVDIKFEHIPDEWTYAVSKENSYW